MARGETNATAAGNGASSSAAVNNNNSSSNNMMEDASDSLIIPITSSSSTSPDLFVEIFPDEVCETPVSVLLKVLRAEQCPSSTWADAAALYMRQHSKHARDSLAVLEAAANEESLLAPTKDVRLLAATGIAHLAMSSKDPHTGTGNSSSSGTLGGSGVNKKSNKDAAEERRLVADQKFTQAASIDTFFPMTWIGRGMLNVAANRPEQAKFFFNTTIKECGPLLPALLGLAAVLYGSDRNYVEAQQTYAQAIRRYPIQSGAATRVGFAHCCYQLGQMDRAKAAFARALEMDPEYVPAMVGAAVLDLAASGSSSDDNTSNSATEAAIKRISMANLLDHSNAMVQNHLANHYFWKWTAVTGTVSVEPNSAVITTSQPMPLNVGEPVRLGTNFETTIVQVLDDVDNVEEDDNSNTTKYKMASPWKQAAARDVKVWKKDYERVFALAKGAYSSTNVPEIQAESLFFLARVYHVRDDMENALKFYERACRLAPHLTPARFGWAQALIVQEQYTAAMEQLQHVLAAQSSTATDAYALLGLLKVRQASSSSNHADETGGGGGGAQLQEEGLADLRKALELDPANPDWVVLEALALQQHKAYYPHALEKYQKAVTLRQRQQWTVPYPLYCNMGVLCHETKKYDQADWNYRRALQALAAEQDPSALTVELNRGTGIGGIRIQHAANDMFFGYCSTNVQAVPVVADATMDDDNDEDQTKGSTTKLWSILDATSVDALPFAKGDHVRLGDSFVSEIVSLDTVTENDNAVVRMGLRDLYLVSTSSSIGTPKVPSEPKTDVDGDTEMTDPAENGDQQPKQAAAVPLSIAVQRENRLLELEEATTIAFNIARLHEASGKTLAAIELHKAIAKRNPLYVNSYLRLACIAVDCGSLNECAEWLKIAAAAAPGNSEVLTLIGNLHLSLCDWKPAQKVFDGLMAQKIQSAEAYSALSMGNLYFANLNVDGRYAKHLQYASDYYKRILSKDPLNAYAANGIGTVLAEKGEIFKAKEAFNRVREVSGDTIADAHLNLGHIYLAQKKHPEALQLYKSYMKRAEDGATPITSKSRTDDVVDVLLYIAFTYFDWARHTEKHNNINAAPADGRYKEAMAHLEKAITMNSKKDVVLKYNLCMTKLQAANCVLQKLTRNIPRTVEEVEEALNGLEESLKVVEAIMKSKEGGGKVSIRTSTLEDFLKHCRANIVSAQSHLEDEKKRAEEEKEEQEIRRLAAEAARTEAALRDAIRKEEEAKEQEERDRRAMEKMQKVDDLRQGWQHEQDLEKNAKEKKTKRSSSGPAAPEVEEDEDAPVRHGLFDDESSDDEDAADAKKGNAATASKSELFGSDDDDDEESRSGADIEKGKKGKDASSESKKEELFASSDSDDDVEFDQKPAASNSDSKAAASTHQELFGDSDDQSSDEELVPTFKRASEVTKTGDSPAAKKRKVADDGDDDASA